MKNSFKKFLEQEQLKPYYFALMERINFEEQNHLILPKIENRFRALDFFEASETKVIILGQDPYYLENQADGLAFSSLLDRTPKSLANMRKEIQKDYPESVFETNRLDYWAKQKVLLLNTCLTVNLNLPNSHKNFGWEIFVHNLLNFIIQENPNVIFGVLGNNALEVVKKLNVNPKQIIFAAHPSPLSYTRGFKDSHFFKRINDMLEEKIDFSIRKEF